MTISKQIEKKLDSVIIYGISGLIIAYLFWMILTL